MSHQEALGRLVAIMRRLRDPRRGCSWDLQQSFATIVPYTIEEAYEVADAIDRGDMAALEDELGDLQLQVVFHAQMAEELGHFTLDGVIGRLWTAIARSELASATSWSAGTRTSSAIPPRRLAGT